MKKFRVAYVVVTFAVMIAMLLAGCGGGASGGDSGGNSGGTGGQPGQGTNGSTTDGTDSKDDDNKNPNTNVSGTVFEQALNKAYTLPDSFDGWHYIVDDFDGDGQQEAFAFTGRPTGTMWDNISIVYVNSSGNITEMLLNSRIQGAPQNTSSTSSKNFSDSCFRYKNEKYVTFTLAPDAACPYSKVFGVHNGRATQNYIDGTCVKKVPEGFIYAAGLDEDLAYVIINGKFESIFTTSDAYKYIDPDYSLATTPLREAWRTYTQYSYMGSGEYFIQGDYDGDGRQEAYVIRGDFKNGYAQSAEICYIGWGGTVLRVSFLSGQLLNILNANYSYSDSLIYAGSQQFVAWQVPGAGHAATYLFGARRGVPYQPQISGEVSYFHQDKSTGRYYAEGSEKYTDDEYFFNDSTGEFYKR